MKKSKFVALMLGVLSLCLFALGMCMALLPEWNAFGIGVLFGIVGIILGLVTIIVWRKMENKAPVKISRKNIGIAAFSIVGALILGVGMCFCMVWDNIVLGTIIGLAGIIFLLFLIPICNGLK